MAKKVRFVEPAKVYRMIKDELDAAYFEVMSKGDLIDRGQLKSFEENLKRGDSSRFILQEINRRDRAVGNGRRRCPVR